MEDISLFHVEKWTDPLFKSEWPEGILYTENGPMVKVNSENLHFWRRIDTKKNGDQVVLVSKNPFPGATEVDLRPRAPAFRILD